MMRPDLLTPGCSSSHRRDDAEQPSVREAAWPSGRFDQDSGIWVRSDVSPQVESRAALFLDRDGVIVEDPGYLCRAADLVLIPGAVEVIASANSRAIPVVQVTNQAGIGRGFYGWEAFLEVEQALARKLAEAGAAIDAALACPYHQDGVSPWKHAAHPARKPRPGMLLEAARLLNLDLKRSWIVGDVTADLLAGRSAGLRGGLHVLTGHGANHRANIIAEAFPGFELRLGRSIEDAAPLLDLLVE